MPTLPVEETKIEEVGVKAFPAAFQNGKYPAVPVAIFMI